MFMRAMTHHEAWDEIGLRTGRSSNCVIVGTVEVVGCRKVRANTNGFGYLR
jgi:hypothetical protein